MATKKTEIIALPDAALGNTRELKVLRYGTKKSGRKAYLQAGLHASEAPGYIVMHYLIDMLDKADQNGLIDSEIILVPVCNPIGISQWHSEYLDGRYDTSTGINFNREHLDLVDEVATDIKGKLGSSADENIRIIRQSFGKAISAVKTADQAEFLKKTLLYFAHDADVVLDLHCDEEALVHVYTGTPLWPDAMDLAAQVGSHATLLAEESGDNPYDEACSSIWWNLAKRFPDNPVPSACLSATVEFRGLADIAYETGKNDAENIFVFLQRRGIINGEAPELPELKNQATPLAGVEHVKSTAAGVVVYPLPLGTRVKKGDVVAQVINPLRDSFEERVIDIKTDIDGLLFTTRDDRHAAPGLILVKVAGEKPIEGKGKKLLTSR